VAGLCLALVVFLALGSPPRLAAQDEQKRLAEAVKRILPPGWKVTTTRAKCTPDDWETDSPKAGFLVEGGDGLSTFRIWFLPRDWIGIRKLPNNAPRTCYWEGILVGSEYKTITFASDETFCNRVHNLFREGSQSTPSLCNSGYDTALDIFRGKLAAADRTAQALIKKHCKTPEQFAEAAHSLVVLGVPAKTVFLLAARQVRGMDRDLFCSTLGLMGGKDAIGVLCDLVADARLEDQRRKYAAMALAGRTDRRIGPALHTAVKQMRDEDALGGVVQSLLWARYTAAAPDLLVAFKRMQNDHYRAELAQVLAAFRHQPAVPELRRLVQGSREKNQAPPSGIELALLRLTGDWGKPSATLRLHVVAPAEAVVGQKLMVTLHAENIGKEPLYRWNGAEMEAGLVIDGKVPKREEMVDGISGRITYFYPGEVYTLTQDISLRITTPGKHTIQFDLGARSNVATVIMRPAKR
jgi:hypothetical protein